jgi:hypothetical protein
MIKKNRSSDGWCCDSSVTHRNRNGVMVIHGTVWAIPHVLLPCPSSSSTVQVPPPAELIDFWWCVFLFDMRNRRGGLEFIPSIFVRSQVEGRLIATVNCSWTQVHFLSFFLEREMICSVDRIPFQIHLILGSWPSPHELAVVKRI